MSSPKAKGKQVIDTADNDDELSADESCDSEHEQPTDEPDTQTSSSKKKKKKSKLAKILNPVSGIAERKIVEAVLEDVKSQHADADEDTVRTALQQLNLKDVIAGKSGLGGKNQKDTGGHKFWATQPVPQYGEGSPEQDGPIESPKPPGELKRYPDPLPKDFEWTTLDIEDPAQLKEVYELLSANYVEDDDASFRFNYSAEFLKWALQPPGYHKEWHLGVRVSANKKLVAFISGVPVTLRVRQSEIKASEINFLCVIKKLRHKRLAPVLIREVTRQCNLKGIYQAIYTGGVFLPTPVSTCRYYHRSLNVPKLLDVKFTFVPRNSTRARMMLQCKLPSTPHLSASGLREMEERDVQEVTDLYRRYMDRFDMSPVMTAEEVGHNFLSGKGIGEVGVSGRREGQVLWAYVVEDPKTKKITDFFSFFSLPSSVIGNIKYSVLDAAYLYYYATETVFEPQAEESGVLKRRLEDLIKDALIVASQAKFDVFNALTLMDNVPLFESLKFGAGDGLLNYYLYNWRTGPLAGMEGKGGVDAGRGVGVVMI